MGKSDPFLQLSKLKSDGGTLLVHRTEVSLVERNKTNSNNNKNQTNGTVTLTRQFMHATYFC